MGDLGDDGGEIERRVGLEDLSGLFLKDDRSGGLDIVQLLRDGLEGE